MMFVFGFLLTILLLWNLMTGNIVNQWQKLDSNEILAANSNLKTDVLALCNKHRSLWSHIDGQPAYGATQGMEFSIKLNDPNISPVKQKPRQLNSLQQESLQQQINDWQRAGKIKQLKFAPANIWVSNFHPVIKPVKGGSQYFAGALI